MAKTSYTFPENLNEEYKGKISFTLKTSGSTGARAPSPPPLLARIGAEVNSFFGSEESKQASVPNTQSRSGSGVTLYLPPGLQYRDNVLYENTDLGIVGGASLEGMQQAAAGQQSLGLMGFGQQFFNNGQSIIEGLKSDALASQNEVAKLVGLQAAKFAPQNLLGGGFSQAAQVQAGVTTNPNTRVLFKRVSMREFAFSFKLIAKSRSEAQTIHEIIKFFRTQLYPETFDIAGVGVGYKFPEMFNIKISYDGTEGTFEPPKIKECYLRDVSTTYNASSMATFKDGKPLEVDLSLSFQEAAALSRKDIEGGY